MTREEILLSDLPAANNVRWTPVRKAAVVAAIDGKAVTRADMLARYNISDAELDGWYASINKAGTPGLRVTRLQIYAQI
jgi:uncharacterized membrane protein